MTQRTEWTKPQWDFAVLEPNDIPAKLTRVTAPRQNLGDAHLRGIAR
jgi:hypothetical protein